MQLGGDDNGWDMEADRAAADIRGRTASWEGKSRWKPERRVIKRVEKNDIGWGRVKLPRTKFTLTCLTIIKASNEAKDLECQSLPAFIG